VFQAFIDDSGTHVPVFVLSGFISSVPDWEQFSHRWRRLLDEPPRLKYFKMQEASKPSGQWQNYKVADRNRRVAKFIQLIADWSHASVSSVIPLSTYKRIAKGFIKPREWDDPYFLSLMDTVIVVATSQANQPPQRRTKFIFDDNPRLAAKLPKHYQEVRKAIAPHHRELIAPSPDFEDDVQFMPLQAADAQSWYYRRLFAERFSNLPFKKDFPKDVFAPIDSIPAMMHFWTRDKLERIAGKKPLRLDKWSLKRFRDIHDVIANADFGIGDDDKAQ
jgi:hypothetical protein